MCVCVSPLQVRVMNDQLMYLERAFIDPLGLPGRPFYRLVSQSQTHTCKVIISSFTCICRRLINQSRTCVLSQLNGTLLCIWLWMLNKTLFSVTWFIVRKILTTSLHIRSLLHTHTYSISHLEALAHAWMIFCNSSSQTFCLWPFKIKRKQYLNNSCMSLLVVTREIWLHIY